MKADPIKSTDDVYRFVEQLKETARQNGCQELYTELDDALLVGSSSLEILGAIRQAILRNWVHIHAIGRPKDLTDAKIVIDFVDAAFGRTSLG